MKQTDAFLSNVGTLLASFKIRNTSSIIGSEIEFASEGSIQQRQNSFFELAHSLSSESVLQPNCLIGGPLKTYPRKIMSILNLLLHQYASYY